MHYVIINGEVVDAQTASLHVSDLGLLRGYAVFDFFRVLGGVPLFLEDYLARFARSVALLGCTLPVRQSALKELVFTLIRRNQLKDAGVQLLLTGGYAEDGFTPSTPNLVLLARPLKPLDAALYRQGAGLISHRYRRELPEAKTTNYAVAISLLPKQRAAGAVDVLYHDGQRIYETARSNIFVLRRDGVLATPAREVLPGVTRKQLLALAHELVEVRETDITLDELAAAQEVMITSTLKGVLPITHIDGRPVGDGQVGRLSQALKARFEAHVQHYLAAYADPMTQ